MAGQHVKGSWFSQLLKGDEGGIMASKKDDDLSLPKHSKPAGQWQAAGTKTRRSTVIRFLIYGIFLFIIIYGLNQVFGTSTIDEIPSPFYNQKPSSRFQPPIEDHSPKPGWMKAVQPESSASKPDTAKPDSSGKNKDKGSEKKAEPVRNYDGPVLFNELGSTLRRISDTNGKMTVNRNILFAAASLRSAATLLPMACEMAAERENYVHFALFGRSEVPIKELLKLNGVDKDCPVIAHDARVDNAAISLETRLTIATIRAMFHVNLYMHPQAIIVDGSYVEEISFLSGLRDQVRAAPCTLIELPERPGPRFAWMAQLDAPALAAWHNVHFDIMIQAPSDGSANLKRLLNSLVRADFGGLTIPHLTIDLPSTIESHVQNELLTFRWPPLSQDFVPHSNLLSIRHRIPRKKVNEEESSVRFLESFWPNQPKSSHVLILSPNTEVTSQFFHYVKYSLLHNMYSSVATRQRWNDKLFGISFAAPSTYLDESKTFVPPKPIEEYKVGALGTAFLWQAPTSDATLIFGEKWVELHGYVSHMLEHVNAVTTSKLLAKKEVSKTQPAWLEYVLQLSRLRGYFTLYPSQQTADTILGVHKDLKNTPEEYEKDAANKPKEDETSVSQASEAFDPSSQLNMLKTLPANGELVPIYKLPWLSWDGREADDAGINDEAAKFRKAFRTEVGQCSEQKLQEPAADPYARDLFCTTNNVAA